MACRVAVSWGVLGLGPGRGKMRRCCSHPTNLLRWRGVDSGDSGIALEKQNLIKQIKLIVSNCSVLSHPIDSAIGAWDIIIAIFREQVWYPSTTVFKCEGA